MRTFVEPGQRLELTAHLAHEGSGFAMTEAEVRVDGKVACNATLTFRHMAFPNAELRKHMEMMADKIEFPRAAMAQV